MQPSRPQMPTLEIFEISETPKNLNIRVKMTDSSYMILSEKLKQYQFGPVQNKGKYNSLKFSYFPEQRSISVMINKYYYLNVLNFKKYEVLIFSRTYQSNFQDYLVLMAQVINGRLIRGDCKLVKYDVFSITILKDFYAINSKNQYEIKRLYLKMSPFYFRRNPYARTKECEQFFAYVLQTHKLDSANKELGPVPADQQFFKNPRISFIDDMYSNQSFTKRFSTRFLVFYLAHSLFTGQAPLDHRYVKEFYMKCASKCAMGAMRLKKISFNFKIPSIEKEKFFKLALFMYCMEQEKDKDFNPVINFEDRQSLSKLLKDRAVSFTLELIQEPESWQKHSNLQNIQQIFLKHLSEALAAGPDYCFVEASPGPPNQKTFKVLNEVGFCWILCSLCFFADRVIFRTINSKIAGENHLSNHIKDAVMYYRLPTSEQYKLKKYAYNYCVQIKSTYNYTSSLTNVKQQQRVKHPYENTINRIIMLRKKVAKDPKDNSNENLEFANTTEQLKGMVIYINEMLKKWNACDCYNEINNFVPNYLNIVVDKNKEKTEKNLFKSVGQWKQVIDGLSALVELLVRGFCTPDTTIVLHILRTYEDSRRSEQLTKLEINQGEEVMLMTFKYLKITIGGWVQLIPSCTYYLEMQRDQTFMYMNGGPREEIMIKSKKQQIEKIMKGYLKKTLKEKIELPPFYYKP